MPVDFTEKRGLGRTGLLVSRLGLAGSYGVPAVAVEKAFHEYGINLFWNNPRKPGIQEGLRNLARSERDKMIIVLHTYDHLGLTVKRSIQKGLRTIGIDYVDVALLGWHNWNPPRKVLSEALRLKEIGLVRFIAMSGHKRKLFGDMARQTDSPIDIFMVRYNAVHRGAEEEIFPYLSAENRQGLATYTATCWGKLLNRKKMPTGENPLTASDCYRFVLSNPHVDLCMMGPSSAREMEEGITAIDKGPLSDREMERVRRIGDYIHG